MKDFYTKGFGGWEQQLVQRVCYREIMGVTRVKYMHITWESFVFLSSIHVLAGKE